MKRETRDARAGDRKKEGSEVRIRRRIVGFVAARCRGRVYIPSAEEDEEEKGGDTNL
jgi:hypothetical protein